MSWSKSSAGTPSECAKEHRDAIVQSGEYLNDSGKQLVKSVADNISNIIAQAACAFCSVTSYGHIDAQGNGTTTIGLTIGASEAPAPAAQPRREPGTHLNDVRGV